MIRLPLVLPVSQRPDRDRAHQADLETFPACHIHSFVSGAGTAAEGDNCIFGIFHLVVFYLDDVVKIVVKFVMLTVGSG